MKVLILLLFSLMSAMASAYTSAQSTEAQIRFRHWVELPEYSHSLQTAREIIQEQLYFLAGYMGYGEGLGAPKQDQSIADIEIEKTAQGIYRAHYTYLGTMTLNKKFSAHLVLALPTNPLTIFSVSESKKKTELNPCTDPDYQMEGSLWYFWNPNRPGCRRILEEGKDFISFKPQVKILPNTKRTFPEYNRLADKKGRIQITILIGKNDFNRLRSPEKQDGKVDDLNAQTFRKLEKYLSRLGFEGRMWSNEEVREIAAQPLNPFPYVKEFTLPLDSPSASEMAVQLVYSNANLDHKTDGLRYFLKYAVENSSVVIYDGHSGLGSNLDEAGIGQQPPKEFRPQIKRDQYQIYFFNSCTSYSFYNQDFFKIKSSSNLEIITAGLETPFQNGEKSEMALIGAIHKWASTGAQTSYQELVEEMENTNLIGVNGDQDNPTSAYKN